MIPYSAEFEKELLSQKMANKEEEKREQDKTDEDLKPKEGEIPSMIPKIVKSVLINLFIMSRI